MESELWGFLNLLQIRTPMNIQWRHQKPVDVGQIRKTESDSLDLFERQYMVRTDEKRKEKRKRGSKFRISFVVISDLIALKENRSAGKMIVKKGLRNWPAHPIARVPRSYWMTVLNEIRNGSVSILSWQQKYMRHASEVFMKSNENAAGPD